MIPFNYHHLYYFYVIAQEGSIAKATTQLRLAQPTLSAQLKQFEEFLGMKLFLREKRKLTLTEDGHKVLAYAKMIFDIGQEFKDRLGDWSVTGRQHLRVGISSSVPKTMVDLFFDFVLKKEPEAYIHLKKDKMETLIQDLEDHTIDVVLTDTPFEASFGGDIQSKFIGRIPMVFCAHANLAKKIRKFPDDLTGQPLILPAAPRQIAYTVREFLHEHYLKPRIVGEIEDVETIRRLALRGHGVAVINKLTVQEAPSKQKLVILDATSKYQMYEKVYIITKKRKYALPLVELIVDRFKFSDY